ncbi:MAG: hypothetical protein ACRCYZ_00990 [Alphaproteobacteria bacterium]
MGSGGASSACSLISSHEVSPQLKHADRIERLILVLTIALYWAVSTGMRPLEKKRRKRPEKSIDL